MLRTMIAAAWTVAYFAGDGRLAAAAQRSGLRRAA
jgi:hypothetical protein